MSLSKVTIKTESSTEGQGGTDSKKGKHPPNTAANSELVSSSGDESEDSFSSASFSSDSELEGKVSLSVPVENEKHLAKGSGTSRQSDEKPESFSSKLNFILADARFFIMKSNNDENIELSKSRNVWSTPPANESRINQAVRETRNVLLIFSVKESGKFSGFARLAYESSRTGQPVKWILPPGLTERALGGVFQLDWVSMHEVPFTKTQHLFNPWNDGKPVKIGRDGQEVEPHVAAELCRLFQPDTNTDWKRILDRSKEASKSISSKRIIGPLAGGIPSRSGFREGRTDNRGRFSQDYPRHTRSTFDAVRRDGNEPTKRRYSGDDFGDSSKRSRNSYDGRTDGMKSAPRYTHSQSRDPIPNYEMSSRKSYGGYSSNGRESYHRPPPPPMPYPPPPPFDSLPPPPRYYDVPPLPDFSTLSTASSSRGHRHQRTSSASPHHERSTSLSRRSDRERNDHRRGEPERSSDGHRRNYDRMYEHRR